MTTATAAEISKLLKCSKLTILRRADKESWPFELIPGRGGKIKHFRITDLPADIAILYNKERMLKKSPPAPLFQKGGDGAAPFLQRGEMTAATPTPARPDYSDNGGMPKLRADQIDLAMAKADLLSLYIRRVEGAGHGSKVKTRKEFMRAYNSGIAWPGLFKKIGKTSWKTIEGWKTKVAKAGGDTFALADTRGYVKSGNTTLTPEIQGVLLQCVLTPNAPHISEAIRTARAVMRQKGIANGHSDDTYRRWINHWKSKNYHTWVFSREGAKALNDKCLVNIHRDYNLINVGDVIVADGHTLNFDIINPWTGKPKRMTLILWYDMKSSMPLGWDIMPTENTAVIASALRRAILRLGFIPKVAYLDNGRAFASRFFNGADLDGEGFSGLFDRLGMRTIFAWPYHGQSKTVERFFGTFAELERLCPSYTGTSIEKKPPRMNRGERLHRQLHDQYFGLGITLEQAHRAIAAWFDEYATRPQRGHLEGMSPAAVFYPAQGPGVDPAELSFLMLAQDVRHIYADGIRFLGETYYHPALFGRRHPVRIRYDLQDRASILVFAPDGGLLCEARPHEKQHPAASILGTEHDRERLAAAINVKKSQEKQASRLCRDLLRDEILPAHDRMVQSIAGPAGQIPPGPPFSKGGGYGDPPFSKGGDDALPEQTDAEIMAEFAQNMADTEAMRAEQSANMPPEPDLPEIDMETETTAAIFRRLDDMDEAGRYEALMELEVRGIMIPKKYQYFMEFFEGREIFKDLQDDYETLRAQLRDKWQTRPADQGPRANLDI